MLFIVLIVMQIVIFLVLVVFLKLILSKNIVKATSHLSEINQDYTMKLEDARQQLREAEKNYDDTMLRSKTDAERLKVQILKEAKEAQESMLSDARRQSEEVISGAGKAKEEILRELDQRIEQQVTQKSCEILGAVTPELITQEMHTQWVEELLKEGFEKLGRLKVSDDVKEAKVYSAFALTPAERSSLSKKLNQKIGREITLVEEVTPKLVAGLKLELGSMVVDGSLRFKIEEVARRVDV